MTNEQFGYITVPSFEQVNLMGILGLTAEKANIYTILAGGFLGLTAWTYLSLSTIPGVIVLALGFGLGALYVAATPSYLNAWEYTKTIYVYLTRPDRYARTEEAAEHVADGAFSTGEDAQELTNIKKFYPSKHIVERQDGSLVAYLEIDPPHRDFSTSDDWIDTARDIADWYNGVIDFPIQLYATTERYPIEDHLEILEDRLDDSDVLGNQNLQKLIEERLAAKREDYENASTEVTQFYIVLSIAESEVAGNTEVNQTALERLQNVPVARHLFIALEQYRSGQASKSDRETKLDMAKKLRRRIQTVQRLGTQNEEYEIGRLSVSEIAALQRRFWRPSESQAPTEMMEPSTLPASTMDMSTDEVEEGVSS